MKRNTYATQGALLIDALQKRPHTYMQMLAHGVSTSPWRRIAESLRADQRLVKSKTRRGLTTWQVVKA
jgi:hypothetical protein